MYETRKNSFSNFTFFPAQTEMTPERHSFDIKTHRSHETLPTIARKTCGKAGVMRISCTDGEGFLLDKQMPLREVKEPVFAQVNTINMDKCFGCLPDISRGVGIGIAAGFGLPRWGWNEELQTED